MICVCATGRYVHQTGYIASKVDPEKPTFPSGNAGPNPDIASPLYHLLDTASFENPNSISSGSLLSLRSPRHLSVAHGCLDEWFTHGTVCDADIGPQDRLDLLYLWVNGSDPIWLDQYEFTRKREFPESSSPHERTGPEPPIRHYRSQGTLKYAMRSGMQAFQRDKSSGIRKVHVLTADMPMSDDDVEDPNNSDYRMGQIPKWLDKHRVFEVTVDSDLGTNSIRRVPLPSGTSAVEAAASLEDPPLQWHFHSEVFRDPLVPLCGITSENGCPADQSAGDWSSSVMPTFNSFAIETRMAWLDDLADFRYVPCALRR